MLRPWQYWHSLGDGCPKKAFVLLTLGDEDVENEKH